MKVSPLPLLAKQPFPTKAGYTFLGWYDGDTLFDFENTSVMSALNLKAKWEIESYNVTFDTDGGSTIDSVPVEHNAKVTKPADPVKEGFTFDGWFVNEVSYDFNDAVTGDLTLKAKWVEEVEEEAFITHITFAALTGKGTSTLSQTTMLAALKAGEQKEDPADPSSIVSVSSVSTVYDGNATSGTFPNTAGLLKFGTGSTNGSFTFKVSRNVHTVKVLAAGWTSSEGQISVNSSTSQTVGTTKTWLEFALEEPTDTITISSVVKRVFVFEIELIGGPVIPDPELDEIVVSSASGVASVEEKQTLQLSAVVYDVDGAVVDNANVTWESLNEEIAEISGTGLVTAVAHGNVMIKVAAVRGSSEKEVQYALEVTERPAAAPNKVVFVGYEEVAAPKLTIPLANGTVPLQAKVFNQYEEEMTGIDLVWESSDTAFATVNNSGTVTLVAGGTTTIKVSVDGDAAIYAELVLTVDADAPVLKTVTIDINNGLPGSREIDGIGFTIISTKKGNNNNPADGLQLDKNAGAIYNTTAFGELVSVTITMNPAGSAKGAVRIYGATTAFQNYGDGSILATGPNKNEYSADSTLNPYTFNFAPGLTYIKLASNTENTRISSIVITYIAA